MTLQFYSENIKLLVAAVHQIISFRESELICNGILTATTIDEITVQIVKLSCVINQVVVFGYSKNTSSNTGTL
jgi:hypothetical protein